MKRGVFSSISDLFATHPPIDEQIAFLSFWDSLTLLDVGHAGALDRP
ncbi:MAG: hypothetical protein JKY09_02820 [Crocinitomicaceae bacterium]|nr:hypothetical protein [Crocinitomicaceae bacterium]